MLYVKVLVLIVFLIVIAGAVSRWLASIRREREQPKKFFGHSHVPTKKTSIVNVPRSRPVPSEVRTELTVDEEVEEDRSSDERDEQALEHDAQQCWNTLYPKTSGSPIERCTSVMKAASEALDHDWNDDEDESTLAAELMPFFVLAGCSVNEIVKFFYDQTGLDVEDIIQAWPKDRRPDGQAFGQAFKLIDDEFGQEDVTAIFDETDLSIQEQMRLHHELDLTTEAIVGGLGDTNFGEDEDVLLKLMVSGGYSLVEALSGFDRNDGYGSVMELALKSELPIETIVEYLNKHQVDADSLDQEMTDQDVDIHDRVKILHAYLFQKEKTPEGAQ